MQRLLAARDFRQILKDELAERSAENPRYSLRAFARDLKIAPSRLSEILNGKQGLSRAAADDIARSLGLGIKEREFFCDLVESLHARSKRDRALANRRLQKRRDELQTVLQRDLLPAISDWYHFGILELTKVSGFRSEPTWIAGRLGITETEVSSAIERLERLGLIKRQQGKLTATLEHSAIPIHPHPESVRRLQSQILSKAGEALNKLPLDRGEFSSEIIAIDQRLVSEAKLAIQRFQQRFYSKFSASATRDDLYCLAMQFFELGS